MDEGIDPVIQKRKVLKTLEDGITEFLSRKRTGAATLKQYRKLLNREPQHSEMIEREYSPTLLMWAAAQEPPLKVWAEFELPHLNTWIKTWKRSPKTANQMIER